MSEYEKWATGLSIAALFFSILSLGVSYYSIFLDRGRLRLKSNYYVTSEGASGYIRLYVVNIGKRPVVLKQWGGNAKDGTWAAESFNNGNLHLNEGQSHSWSVTRDAACYTDDDGNFFEYIDLWVEDSAGKRHVFKDSHKHVRRFWEKNSNAGSA